MSTVTRITQTLCSRIDHLVRQVENHESLAESALRDVQRSFARARIQLERVRRDGSRLAHQLEDARSKSASWRDRAARESDEDKALECLKRSKACARLATQLEERLSDHRAAEKRLRGDVALVEQRLNELREKRNLLRTRESRAQALRAARAADSCRANDLDDVFDRWEERIATIELDEAPSTCVGIDSFELEFDEQEECDELRLELEELRRATAEEE